MITLWEQYRTMVCPLLKVMVPCRWYADENKTAVVEYLQGWHNELHEKAVLQHRPIPLPAPSLGAHALDQ